MSCCHDSAIHLVVQDGPTTPFAGSQIIFFGVARTYPSMRLASFVDHCRQAEASGDTKAVRKLLHLFRSRVMQEGMEPLSWVLIFSASLIRGRYGDQRLFERLESVVIA